MPLLVTIRTVGGVEKPADPVTVSGLTPPGAMVPKLNSRFPAAVLEKELQVQVSVLAVMETPNVASALLRITAELAELPPTTPSSLPPLTVVVPVNVFMPARD